MIGIDARRIVAVMADTHSIGYFAKMEFIRKAMHSHAFNAISAESAIASFIFTASPQPTSWSFLHVIPESFFGCSVLHSLVAFRVKENGYFLDATKRVTVKVNP